jgi:hypothetical protein
MKTFKVIKSGGSVTAGAGHISNQSAVRRTRQDDTTEHSIRGVLGIQGAATLYALGIRANAASSNQRYLVLENLRTTTSGAAVTNGNYRRLESQFLQTLSQRHPLRSHLFSRPPRPSATHSNERTGDPRVRDWGLLATLSDSTVASWLDAATRSRGKGTAGAGQRPGEGLTLLLRLGKRRSIEPKRWRVAGACLHACSWASGAVVRLGASSDAARPVCPLRQSTAHTGRSSHDQNVLQLPVRPVAG